MAKLNVKGIFLRYLLDRSVDTIRSRFKPDGPLLRSGLLSIDSDGEVNLMDRFATGWPSPQATPTLTRRVCCWAPRPRANSSGRISTTLLKIGTTSKGC